jgi:MerR family redox-sensitive transcriptional activator SoxR
MMDSWISIGQLARRSGVAASALRFYEHKGLIRSLRADGKQRQFHKDTLRRVAFIRIAQTVGLTLDEIGQALSSLPEKRTPTISDWQRLSRSWRPLLLSKIATLEALNDQLGSCIGCGCLSLEKCMLYNPNDDAASLGSGARYLLGNSPADIRKRSRRQAPRI